MLGKIKAAIAKNAINCLSFIKTKKNQLDQHPVIQLVLFSVLIIFVLEVLSRRSIFKAMGFVVANPLMFIYNVLIVLLTLSVTMMFSRKRFFLVLITLLWVTLGAVNFILLGFRTTPLAAMDFYILDFVSSIIHIYLNSFQIALIVAAVILVMIGLIFLWIKLKKQKAQYKLPLVILCVIAILMPVVANVSLKVKALSTNYGNLAEAYSEYGFAYCFSNSLFDRGIKKPNEYSEENIDKVLRKIEGEQEIVDVISEVPSGIEKSNSEEKPNIIFVQLESFFDVNLLLDYSFSEDPVPNFTHLKNNYSSGYLTVPSIGAGTANTEFEIITGMNLEHFGAGEYPYKTILQKSTSESIPYNLEELGYHSHAIHNNTGSFYDRNKIFPKLGFDSYSSIEYMNQVEYNPVGWAKDYILTPEILKALNAKDTRDFIYAISVQPHGKYPETAIENQRIQVVVDSSKRQLLSTLEESTKSSAEVVKHIEKGYKNSFEYFVNQLYETDEFIGELIAALSDFDEPSVVVFFGDHLPSLSFEDEDLINNNKFQTEYVIWSNFPLEKVDRDLKAYQISAYLMERLGYENGILTKFHQRYEGEEDYQDKLKLLQYDMLYGSKNVYNGENPYVEKMLQMGVHEIVITDVIEKGEALFIEGENFTPWSIVYIGDKQKETLFIDENTLIVPYEKYNEDSIYVAQVTDDNLILSKSKEW